MSHLKKLIRWLFTPPAPTTNLTTNPTTCPHCHGIGYDASGYHCTCTGE